MQANNNLHQAPANVKENEENSEFRIPEAQYLQPAYINFSNLYLPSLSGLAGSP